jgi:hypothetical protein
MVMAIEPGQWRLHIIVFGNVDVPRAGGAGPGDNKRDSSSSGLICRCGFRYLSQGRASPHVTVDKNVAAESLRLPNGSTDFNGFAPFSTSFGIG